MQNNTPAPSKNNCCAIIVTFYPDALFLERLQAIREVFSTVIIVDNASNTTFQRNLRTLSSASLNIIQNTTNAGLAKALNQGLEYAITHSFVWAMTFDQDTWVYPEILHALSNLYKHSPRKPVMLGCNYWHAALNRPFLHPPFEKPSIERNTLITSGTLMSLRLPALIGYFREDYFIDSIDHEYSLRACRQGYSLLMSTQVLMRHTIGEKETYRRASWFRIPEHSPLRKYYITRNSLTTAYEYARQQPIWALRQIARLALECLAILVYEQQKRQKFLAIRLGIWHAVTGKLGELTLSSQPWLSHE